MNKKIRKEDITDAMDDDDKYYVDSNAPTILRTERIRFEEEGTMNRIKLTMDSSKGGRFFLYKEEKSKTEPLPEKLNPPKEKNDDEALNGHSDELSDLPF